MTMPYAIGTKHLKQAGRYGYYVVLRHHSRMTKCHALQLVCFRIKLRSELATGLRCQEHTSMMYSVVASILLVVNHQ